MKRIRTEIAAALLALAGGAASADTTMNDAFTASATVLSAGPPASIEIQLTARLPIAELTLTSSRGNVAIVDCSLESMTAGAHRTCRVSLTAPADEKYMTLQLVARVATLAPTAEPQLEVQGFTFENRSFSSVVRPQSTQSRLKAR